jgi:type II secretory pathway component GspD/PulD (secretin)
MKTKNRIIILAGLAGGLLAATAAPAADEAETNAPTADTNAVVQSAAPTSNQTTVAPDPATNSAAEFSPGQGIRMNFRGVPLETVLNYMSKAAGFVIHPQVSLNGRVDAWSDQPLSKDEALSLVEHVLTDNGYAVIRDGRILTIVSATEARRKDVPVIRFAGVDNIPRNNEVATYIIPVRTLNPVALMKNLQPLIGQDTDLQANESANSLLITDTQINIRRLADIVMKLDSVSSSINTIKVFPLKYADAKALASLVKDLFPSQNGTGGGTRGGGGVAGGRFGGGGGRGGGGGGGGGGANGFAQMMGFGGGGSGGDTSSGGQTPGSRITATSDDHSNALVVSAPEDLIPTIDELVTKIDQPVDDVTEIKLFHFKHADATEMVALLGNLFPDQSSSSDASGTRMQFGGPGGGPMGMMGGGAQQTGSSSGQSQYMKKMGSVVAVADQRTQSMMVSASRDLMPQIEDMVNQMDEIDAGTQHVHYLALKNAESQDVQQIIQDLFPAGSTSRSTTTQNNPLLQRSQTVSQNQLSTGVSSGISSGSGAGGAGGGSRGGL